MTHVDVSVVLNMHREAYFLMPTLRSLERCAEVATERGIVVELVAVFDNADKETREAFRKECLQSFARIVVVDVALGSLGLARNAGIERASGEYIWTSDADDLVSSNCIVALLDTARTHKNKKVAVFIEYLCAFGDKFFNCRYVGSEYLTPADFAFQHPYVSRIFVRRDAFECISYEDLRVTSGFAYEDWFLNCELRALGYEMAIAPETVFFYRQREGSLLRQADKQSARLIPQSRLFKVEKFLKDMETRRSQVGDWSEFMAKREAVFHDDNTKSFFQSERLVKYLAEAARLEPEIEPESVEQAQSYSPLPWDGRHWGMEMEALYRLLSTHQFTDVVLLPWLKPGGAEKYIIHILEELCLQNAETRILVVTGQSAESHKWISRLPNGSVFVDLYNTFPLLDDRSRETMLVRGLLAVAGEGARLHVKSSEFAHRMFDSFGTVLASWFRVVYYRFCDDTYEWRGETLRGPWGVKVMRRHLSKFWRVISDCKATVDADRHLVGGSLDRYRTIYTKCEVKMCARDEYRGSPRLLWASRISAQKQPEILVQIANVLHHEGCDVRIDVFGTPDLGMDVQEVFRGAPELLEYKGSFSEFSELPVEQYDGFIYTSRFDGLPNILLEVLASGLPVIAPNVGGISEIVRTGSTGWLVDVSGSDAVNHYVNAILEFCADPCNARLLGRKAQKLVELQHGKNKFSVAVKEVLGES